MTLLLEDLKKGMKLFRFDCIDVHPVTDKEYARVEVITVVSWTKSSITYCPGGTARRRMTAGELPRWSTSKSEALARAHDRYQDEIGDIPQKLRRLVADAETVLQAQRQAELDEGLV